jgi:hypothetical protein
MRTKRAHFVADAAISGEWVVFPPYFAIICAAKGRWTDGHARRVTKN